MCYLYRGASAKNLLHRAVSSLFGDDAQAICDVRRNIWRNLPEWLWSSKANLDARNRWHAVS